eukprot:5226561-Alexandrium_andersonii.AAC.1
MSLKNLNCWSQGPSPPRAALPAGPLEEEEEPQHRVEQCAVPASTLAAAAGRRRCAESRPERQAGTPCSPP